MVDAFVQAVGTILSPTVFLVIVLGTVVSVILGIIPGISGGTGLVLLLPFVFGGNPDIMLPLLTTFTAVSVTGGSISAVLIGVPGDAANAATVLDGFPMTRRGEGARGVGAALASSMLGGAAPVIFAFLMIPLLVPLVLHFRSPEMLFMILLALCFLASLTRGSVIKGLISAGLGLLIATIGYQAVKGVERFTFGSLYLYDGISVVVIVMGIFALPTLAALGRSGETISSVDMPSSIATYRQLLKGVRDVLHHWWLWLRCTIIGYIVGVIPGIGGSTAIWVAYGHAKQTSKHPEEFGTGCVEGIIGPESANNAKDAGAMLTTLAFGIPGSAQMVLILAAFTLMGIQPGPRMLTEHTALSFSLLQTIFLSNVLAGLICLAAVPYLVKVTRISPVYLFCFILPIVFIGIYAYNLRFMDLITLLIVTAMALLLRRFGYSLPALVLGFILGSLVELYLWHSLDMFGPLFFLSPISLVLMFIILFVLLRNIIKKLFLRLFKRAEKDLVKELATASEAKEIMGMKADGIRKMTPSSYFLIAILAIVLFFGTYSFTYATIKTTLLPAVVCGFVFILAVIELRRELVAAGKANTATEQKAKKSETDDADALLKYGPVFGWMAGFVLAIYLVGFLGAIPLFMFAYLRLFGHRGWLQSIVLPVVATSFIYALFVIVLQVNLFPGAFFE